MLEPDSVDTRILQEYLLRTKPDTTPCSASTKEVYPPDKSKTVTMMKTKQSQCFHAESPIQRQP
jgi:hypothetical protein